MSNDRITIRYSRYMISKWTEHAYVVYSGLKQFAENQKMISHGVTQRLKPSQNWPKENTTASFKTENYICIQDEIYVDGSSEGTGRNLGIFILCVCEQGLSIYKRP